jgi:hypothetical protein
MLPILVALNMGYGHLRPAHALAERLGVPVYEADRAPIAGPAEAKLWERARVLYEGLTRVSQLPAAAPLRSLLSEITEIPPLFPRRDLSAPTAGVRLLRLLAARGMGRGLVERMRSTGAPLLSTFFAPAVIADHVGAERVYCVVTDADVNRVWAPIDPARARVNYLAPSARVARRLASYGVRPERIEVTGFPLPHELLGGPELPVARRNLAARLVRLDPTGAFRRALGDDLERALGPLPREHEGAPPHVVFAVGGAGAQANLVAEFLPGFVAPLRRRALRLTLVAGVRAELRDQFRAAAAALGLEPGRDLGILHAETHDAYFRAFNALLAETDVLWSKPSEIAFFAALGLGMVFTWPVGEHEAYNRRFVIEAGAGVRQEEPRYAAEWLADWLADGTLAGAAWSGFRRLPSRGLYRIVERVTTAAM